MSNGGTTLTIGGGTSRGTTASSAKASALPDACTLLEPAQVKAVTGKETAPNKSPITGGAGGPAYVGCSWGQIASENPFVAVQISRPSGDANVDYLKVLVGTAGDKGTPVAIGENGMVLNRAYIPGGGGVGKSIMFTKNGDTVLVGLVNGTEDQLKAAANAVAANMS